MPGAPCLRDAKEAGMGYSIRPLPGSGPGGDLLPDVDLSAFFISLVGGKRVGYEKPCDTFLFMTGSACGRNGGWF